MTFFGYQNELNDRNFADKKGYFMKMLLQFHKLVKYSSRTRLKRCQPMTLLYRVLYMAQLRKPTSLELFPSVG